MSKRETREHVWEAFARDDAEWYVLTADRDSGELRDGELFLEAGRDEVREVLESTGRWLERRETAVEIGCGVGRLAIPIAREFSRLVAVDVAPTMLEKLSANCSRFGVTNIEPVLAHDEWHRDLRADLIYSRLVLQHIEALDEIDRYMARIREGLGDGSVGYLQFDTRPATLSYRLRNALPDRLMPRRWRRGIRRIRRSPDLVRSLLRDRGLAVVEELRPDTEDHVFLVRAA